MALGLGLLAAGAGSNILGGLLSGYGASRGAAAASGDVRRAMAENRAKTEQMEQRAEQLQQPWMKGGRQAFGDLERFRMRESDPYEQREFGGVDLTQDPGYKFRMSEGLKALDTSAAKRGSLFSGMHQKELMDRAQNLASQEYGDAYGRQYGQFRDTEQDRMNLFGQQRGYQQSLDAARMGQLQNLSRQGQEATGQLSGALRGIGQDELQNMMMLRGRQADLSATQAALPWQMAGGALAGLGNAASGFGKYYMSK